jgi:hypothetical protein
MGFLGEIFTQSGRAPRMPYSNVVPGITDPDVAEAIAAWQAAKFCAV